jgi:hypothetical protein
MIQYDEQTLQLIEEEISYIYDSDATGYPEGEYLLDLRKRSMNSIVRCLLFSQTLC